MVSQPELTRLFVQGREPYEIPSASNVAVREPEDTAHDAVIVGYGWAAYAARGLDGKIDYYEGWEGYSSATSTQLGKIRRVFEEEGADWKRVDDKPQYGDGIEWRRGQAGERRF